MEEKKRKKNTKINVEKPTNEMKKKEVKLNNYRRKRRIKKLNTTKESHERNR